MARFNLLLKGFLFTAIFVLSYVLLVERDIPLSGEIHGSDLALFSNSNDSSSSNNDSTIFVSHSW